MRPRAANFGCLILDNGLFISNLSGSCGLDMSHVTSNDVTWLIYLQREIDTLIQVSYQSQTAFAKQERAPDTSLY